MVRAIADPALERKSIDGFTFPLGVYPVEEMTPRAGYTMEFEQSDGSSGEGGGEGGGGLGDAGDLEEWPDRYVYDIVISNDRLESLWRALVSLMPGRVYPILDYIGLDAYREIDPYIAYERVGLDRVSEAIGRCRDFFFEDGMVGFGVMIDEPFLYIFIDEHKIVTVRAEPGQRERVEAVLAAFDLAAVDEPAGSDAAAHEHRGVLLAPPDRPELLGGEEVVERVRESWRVTLNVDPETNIDDDGRSLGMTNWRCLVRCATEKRPEPRYAEVLLAAGCLGDAEEVAQQTAWGQVESDSSGDGDGGGAGDGGGGDGGGGDDEGWSEVVVVLADRVRPKQAGEMLKKIGGDAAGYAAKALGVKKLRKVQVFSIRMLS